MTRTTTVKVDEDVVKELAEGGRALGGIGWTRMLLIVAKEWADKQRKAKEKVS